MRLVLVVTSVASVCSATVAAAQWGGTPGGVSLGITAGAVRSRDAGTGRVLDVDARWTVPRARWLSVMGAASLTGYGRTDLVTSMADIAPTDNPLYSVFSLQARGASGMLGLEAAATHGRVRPYLHALGGVTRVTVGGEWMRAFTNGSATARPYMSTDPPVPADEMRASSRSARIGSGVRLALSRTVHADIGVRRTLVGPTTWVRTILPSYSSFFDSSLANPSHDYRRSLSSWGVTAGLRLAR